MITNEQQHEIMDAINSRAKQTHGEVKILEWDWDNNTITALFPYDINEQTIKFEFFYSDVEITIQNIAITINERLQDMINILNDCKF